MCCYESTHEYRANKLKNEIVHYNIQGHEAEAVGLSCDRMCT